jgi:PTS system nitrogen regulatory IIA component
MPPLRIADVIAPERIVPQLKAANAQRAIAALSRLVAAEAGISELDVLLSVRAAQRLTGFGVGRGVAIPHGVVGGLSAPLGAFARLKTPIEFGAADGRPVDLVFLIAAAPAQPATLLPLLARVARRLRDREVLKHLRAECSAEAIYAVLATEAWRPHVPPPRRKSGRRAVSIGAEHPV